MPSLLPLRLAPDPPFLQAPGKALLAGVADEPLPLRRGFREQTLRLRSGPGPDTLRLSRQVSQVQDNCVPGDALGFGLTDHRPTRSPVNQTSCSASPPR